MGAGFTVLLALMGAMTAAGDPADWVTPADYPPASVLAREQGDVMVMLQVGANGAPTSCAVEESSGYPALDARTCPLIMSRARFQTDSARQQRMRVEWRHPAIPSATYREEFGGARPTNRENWQKPGDFPTAMVGQDYAGWVGLAFRISSEGRVDKCVTDHPSGNPELDRYSCQLLQRRARFAPARDRFGDPLETHARTSMSWFSGSAAPDR